MQHFEIPQQHPVAALVLLFDEEHPALHLRVAVGIQLRLALDHYGDFDYLVQLLFPAVVGHFDGNVARSLLADFARGLVECPVAVRAFEIPVVGLAVDLGGFGGGADARLVPDGCQKRFNADWNTGLVGDFDGL